ncbi:unnamed protein product, partial [marine sediment metagenome]
AIAEEVRKRKRALGLVKDGGVIDEAEHLIYVEARTRLAELH